MKERITGRQTLTSMMERGDVPLGAFITSTDAGLTAASAAAGCDFVIIDQEHAPNDAQSTLGHIRAAEANDCVPIVRVIDSRPEGVQQSLDLGAHGVMAPKVGTAEQARALVKATQYTAGGRGMCPVVEAARWDIENWPNHRDSSNREIMMIPLIETKEGVDNLDSIMAVDGIDFVFFGFADLTQDLGLEGPEAAPILEAMWSSAVERASQAGVRIGCPLGRSGIAAADFGVVGPSDVRVMYNGMRAAVEAGRAIVASAT